MGIVTVAKSCYEDALQRIDKIVQAPEKFIAPDPDLQVELRDLVKFVYDHAGDLSQYGSVPELIVEGLDAEQIWEELELRTEPLLDRVQQCLSEYLAAAQRAQANSSVDKRSNTENVQQSKWALSDPGSDRPESEDDNDHLADLSNDDEEGENSRNNDHESDHANDNDCSDETSSDDADSDDADSGDSGFDAAAPKKRPRHGVDNDFFNIDDMEEFADQMEMPSDGNDANANDEPKTDDDDDEESIDMLHDFEDDPGAQYDDLFDDAGSKLASIHGIASDDEFAGLSEFKKRQHRLKKEIEQLEERNLAGRSWELMGEVQAADRPADALIDANLDFQMADKQPVVITQTVTNDLEDLIRQRIKDGAYDDVERKAVPVAKPFRPRSELEADKSNIGLADLYEKEYVEKATGLVDAEERLSHEHKQIASLFASVCYKLDALSNFHFTPKRVREEIFVRTNVPAVAMEEAMPMAVSAAQAAAPEEIYAPARHEPVADAELTRDEKKARRRLKKTRGKKQREQKAAEDELRAQHDTRFKAKLDQKAALQTIRANTKIESWTAGADPTAFTRSTAFFKKIQEAESRRGLPTPVPLARRAPASAPSSSFKL